MIKSCSSITLLVLLGCATTHRDSGDAAASSHDAIDAITDASIATVDAAPPIDSNVDSNQSQLDAGAGPTDAPPIDSAPIGADATPSPDAPSGPVTVGEYTYSAVPSYLLNPPAVAWHPNGDYALILNYEDTIYKYIASSNAVESVSTQGTAVRWINITFTPDGETAIILAYHSTNEEGRIYLWDSDSETLSEFESQRFSGGRYENIEFSPTGTEAKLLGTKPNSGGAYIAYLWDFSVSDGKSNLSATATSARCEDLDWASDSFDLSTVAITCGHGGVDLYHINGAGMWVRHNMNAGNTSYISARPQGDYALAVTDSSHKLYHFAQGAWDTDFYSPALSGSLNVEFSSSGSRALIIGGYDSSTDSAQIFEYRHDLYTSDDIFPVFLSNFDSPPYSANSQVHLNDVAWRPGCDEGIIVGGANTFSITRGYVIRFQVINGLPCVE